MGHLIHIQNRVIGEIKTKFGVKLNKQRKILFQAGIKPKVILEGRCRNDDHDDENDEDDEHCEDDKYKTDKNNNEEDDNDDGNNDINFINKERIDEDCGESQNDRDMDNDKVSGTD